MRSKQNKCRTKPAHRTGQSRGLNQVKPQKSKRRAIVLCSYLSMDLESGFVSRLDGIPRCSSLTTKELQQNWKEVKRRDRPVTLLFEIPSYRIVEQAFSKHVVSY